MENISFSDPDDIPLPPDEVEIRNLNAEPYEDGKRVQIYLTFTPFQKNPSADIKIFDNQDKEVASVNIIETIDPDTKITLHLPQKASPGEYRVRAKAFYLEHNLDPEAETVEKPEKKPIGQKETFFVIPE